jgi:hypothetical protein
MIRHTLLAIGLCGILTLALPSHGKNSAKPAARPNILFIIMDDVGIDQVAHLFDYDTDDQPQTPNIDQLASAGVSFRNVWAMPACSTSRAVFFTGRFPLRTDVLGALGKSDLANSMVSRYETTAPKLLARRGYQSALFGKFHIALQGNDPAGDRAPHSLGWDYFAGWLDETGDPSSIDKTAGGVAPEKDPTKASAPCGFVRSEAAGGADEGACYMPDGSCSELATDGGVPPGRTCRDRGGILVADDVCRPNPADLDLDWQTLNSHFVSPVVYNFPDGKLEVLNYRDPRARTFRAEFAVDEAISWIDGRPAGQPWMATVSFASDHTPLVQPPAAETQGDDDAAEISDLDCADPEDQRRISDLLIESLDAQVARLLVGAGLAKQNGDGSLNYEPSKTDTMVILLGDNGSLGTTVKQPFDATRAKGSAYQTGVWAPLVITGPLVNSPNRTVTHMVNIADLYTLFGEIAGIRDVRREVAPRLFDGEPMLPYLVNPTQPSIRLWNFTQVGVNVQVGDAINPPCTIGTACTQIPVSASVCADNGGVWWGSDHTDPNTNGDPTKDPPVPPIPSTGFTNCCQVNQYVVTYGVAGAFTIDPPTAVAIRDDQYKLVENTYIPYDPNQPCPTKATSEYEFYEINEDKPLPKLDLIDTNLDTDALTVEQLQHYNVLTQKLTSLIHSEPACPGDGNGDLVVDQKDLRDYQSIVRDGGGSSVYDFDHDGYTNGSDEAVIQENLRTDCRSF